MVGEDGTLARVDYKRGSSDLWSRASFAGWENRRYGCVGPIWRKDLISFLAMKPGESPDRASARRLFGVPDGFLAGRSQGRQEIEAAKQFAAQLPFGEGDSWSTVAPRSCREAPPGGASRFRRSRI